MLCFGAMNWSISWFDPSGRSPAEIAAQLTTLVRRGALATCAPGAGPVRPDPEGERRPAAETGATEDHSRG